MNTDLADILDFLNKAQNGEIMYPPQWQWLGTIAYIFPLRNLILWEFGPIAAIFSLTGLIVFVIYICKGLINKNWYTFLINKVLLNPLFLYTGYMLVYFIYLGGKFVKAGRYFFPIYIPLILLGVWLISKIKGKWKNIIMLIVILSQICCGLAYLNIYIQENTRVAASLWIYNNIPANSQITYELWDDSLPLGLNISTPYNINEMTVFDDPDNAEKLEKLYTPFSKAEYIILSSARAKYTIGKLPATFPHMVNYYKKLDNGQLGFKLVHEEHSYPSLFGLEFNDESAEEPFWVYDHPTVWIYKRDRQLSLEEFKDQLTQPLDTFVDDD